jgi:hypothetical protein
MQVADIRFERKTLRWGEQGPLAARFPEQSMIRKSGNRFSEKIMLKQTDEFMMRFHRIAS